MAFIACPPHLHDPYLAPLKHSQAAAAESKQYKNATNVLSDGFQSSRLA